MTDLFKRKDAAEATLERVEANLSRLAAENVKLREAAEAALKPFEDCDGFDPRLTTSKHRADHALAIHALRRVLNEGSSAETAEQARLALVSEVLRLREENKVLAGLSIVLRARAAEAKLARIEALAEEWAAGKGLATVGFAAALQQALQGDP